MKTRYIAPSTAAMGKFFPIPRIHSKSSQVNLYLTHKYVNIVEKKNVYIFVEKSLIIYNILYI